MTVRLISTIANLCAVRSRCLWMVLAVAVLGFAAPHGVAFAQEAVDPEVATEADLQLESADGEGVVAGEPVETGEELHDDELHGDEAHGEGDHALPPLLSFNFGSAIWNLFIFLVTLLILGVFVWPQILAGLQAREDKIQADIAGAEKANAEAKATLAGYQAQLAEAQNKIQDMMSEARKNAEKVGAGIVEQAKADADRQRERAIADIETAKSVAISELAGQTSDLAISLARQVVGRELNPQDHAELIRQSLDRLPSQN